MKSQYLHGFIGLSLYFLSASSVNASVILSEDFEDGVLDPMISIQKIGSFSSNTGIKPFSAIEGSNAFGFGRSTCSVNCFENYATEIVISFNEPTFVTSISFSEMEVFGNWGSSGRVLADGALVGDYFGFGRLPYNDGIADTTYRDRIFDINNTISQLVLHVHDITNVSEIYIDNIVVSTVPIPGALWLFGTGVIGLAGIARRKRANNQ